jgi:chromosome segregation ATPase
VTGVLSCSLPICTLEQEENKVLRAQLELGQVRQEIDRRVAEKEEEFNNTRTNHLRAMESLAASLETEQRSKGEALRIKKKLEGEINELEIGLDHANKANSEGLKSIKRYQGQLRETIQLFEDEARARGLIMEAVGISERKAAALSGEAEESRALIDSAERSKRQIEGEIADARYAVNEIQSINARDMSTKRSLEGSIHTLQAEIDAMLMAAKNAEEKSKKAMVDAARLADELRAEQDHATSMASAKNALNNQFGDLEARLADAEAAAAKGGKAAMAKLEMKVRELEADLANTQARTGEYAKAYQRSERKVKELQFSQEEDKKNQDRMSDLANKLQQKIKTYKSQIEDAEEIAALNLAKFRKAQQELEETEERAKMAGSVLMM